MTDTTQRIPEPLTPTDEAAFRESVAAIAANMGEDDYSLQWSNHVPQRLLATLDRDRSAANERIAVLEGALRELLGDHQHRLHRDDDPECPVERARSALAATETEPCKECGEPPTAPQHDLEAILSQSTQDFAVHVYFPRRSALGATETEPGEGT